MTGSTTGARPPSTNMSKKKRRKMKQMEGLLVVSRQELDDHHKPRSVKAKKVHVLLQPQQLQLAYSAQEDQEMRDVLGRIDLIDSKLEQTPDGFIVYGATHGKKFHLHDKDKATIDAWFYAVYASITELVRTPIDVSTNELSTLQFAAVLSGSHRDEASDAVEYELSCQLVVPSRSLDEPSIRWKVWRTAAEIQAFDDELRRIPVAASIVRDVVFPRDRKRDSLFGGLRKKSVQEVKEQQLAIYIQRLFSFSDLDLAADPTTRAAIRHFLRFNHFFELSCERSEDNNAEYSIPDSTSSFEAHHSMEAPAFHGSGDQHFHDEASQLFPSASSVEPLSQAALQPPFSEPTHSISRSASLQFDEEYEEISDVEPETDPAAAKKLHKQVIRTVREIFAGDEDRVRDFQDQTKDFGRDRSDVREYCAFLHGALGAKQCCAILPMMARLLLDEEKRRALLEARSAIIRKAVRRNRRRSKQFSESVVLQQQRRQATEYHETFSAPMKTRPKSDSLSVLMSQSSLSGHRFEPQHRSSMIEPRSVSSFETHASSGQKPNGGDEYGRKSLPDVRRKLDSRKSITLFGEPLHNETIEEENPASWDSDDVSNTESSEPQQHEPVATDAVKSLPPVFRRINSNPWLQQPRSAPSTDLPAYGQRASSTGRDPYREVDQFGHSVHTVEDHDSSRDHQPAAADSAENPVLARLRKQGAVNFMLR